MSKQMYLDLAIAVLLLLPLLRLRRHWVRSRRVDATATIVIAALALIGLFGHL